MFTTSGFLFCPFRLHPKRTRKREEKQKRTMMGPWARGKKQAIIIV